jgi:hypothetical protein
MEAIELSFGRWTFPSGGAARRECETRLRKYKTGDYLRGDDRKFFLSLLRDRYPYFTESFYGDELDPDLADDPSLQLVDWSRFTSPVKRGQGLRAIREDGSWRPVSWRRCVDKVSHLTWVIAAARLAVVSQHRAFLRDRITRLGNVSDVSGLAKERLVVDYPLELSMTSLVRDWLKASGLDESEIEVTQSGELAEELLRADWQDYHRRHAMLRAVTQAERSPYEA